MPDARTAYLMSVAACPTHRVLDRMGDRSVTASVPPQVEYRLTPLGESLLPVLAVVSQWAEQHIGAIDTARADYDRPSSP